MAPNISSYALYLLSKLVQEINGTCTQTCTQSAAAIQMQTRILGACIKP